MINATNLYVELYAELWRTMRKPNSLTALKINKLTRPGLYGDGGGLALQVQSGPTKSWVFRYMRAGQPHKMGLGPLALVSLAEAREKALQAKKLLLAGIDPLQARADERAQAAADALRTITFKECAALHCRPSDELEKRQACGAVEVDETYAEPIIGTLTAQVVDTTAVMKVLEQEVPDRDSKPKRLWHVFIRKPHTVSAVVSRKDLWIGAAARGYRSGENPARWRGHIDKLLPSRSKLARVRHHPALPYQQIGEFVETLRTRSGIAARALEFTILTAARTGEVIGARWQEFDRKTAMWVVPGERMKSGREHRVPLSDRVLEILSSLPTEGEFVFPGRYEGTPMSNMAMLATLKDMGRGDLTVHGFRSTFRDWASEMTAFPHEVQEMALAHIVGNKVEAAYRRGDLLEASSADGRLGGILHETNKRRHYSHPSERLIVGSNQERVSITGMNWVSARSAEQLLSVSARIEMSILQTSASKGRHRRGRNCNGSVRPSRQDFSFPRWNNLPRARDASHKQTVWNAEEFKQAVFGVGTPYPANAFSRIAGHQFSELGASTSV